MSMYVHGVHSWVWMAVGGHNWGLAHGKEAKRAADDRYQSCVHARTVKRQSKTRTDEEGQGRLVESRVHTGDILLGRKTPTKAEKNIRKQKSKQNGKERSGNKHIHIYKNTTIQCIIYAIKSTKTSKNKVDKNNNVKLIQLPAPDTRKRKNARTKTRSNGERTQPKPKQETKQRKQHHYFGSQKLFNHSKSKRKTANISKKLFWTKSELGTNRKSP